MADQLGPSSYVQEVNAPSSQAQGNVSGGVGTSGVSGGGAQLTRMAPGGEFQKQAQIDGEMYDSIFKFAEKIAEPRIKEMQQKQFVFGMSQVARGKALGDLKKEQPWLSKVVGDTFVVEGARKYATAKAQTDMAIGLQKDKDKLADMTPDEANAEYLRRGDALMTGDAQADAEIMATNLNNMPSFMEQHQKMYTTKIQDNLGKAQTAAIIAAGKLVDEDYKEVLAGRKTPEEHAAFAQQTMHNAAAKSDAITEETYNNAVGSSIRVLAANGNNTGLKAMMSDEEAAKNLSPELQAARQLVMKGADAQKMSDTEKAPENQTKISETHAAIASAIEKGDFEEVKRLGTALNDYFHVQTGTDHDVIDVADTVAKGMIRFNNNNAESILARNMYENRKEFQAALLAKRTEIATRAKAGKPVSAQEAQQMSNELSNKFFQKVSSGDLGQADLMSFVQLSEAEQEKYLRNTEEATRKEDKLVETKKGIDSAATSLRMGGDGTDLAVLQNDGQREAAVTAALEQNKRNLTERKIGTLSAQADSADGKTPALKTDVDKSAALGMEIKTTTAKTFGGLRPVQDVELTPDDISENQVKANAIILAAASGPNAYVYPKTKFEFERILNNPVYNPVEVDRINQFIQQAHQDTSGVSQHALDKIIPREQQKRLEMFNQLSMQNGNESKMNEIWGQSMQGPAPSYDTFHPKGVSIPLPDDAKGNEELQPYKEYIMEKNPNLSEDDVQLTSAAARMKHNVEQSYKEGAKGSPEQIKGRAYAGVIDSNDLSVNGYVIERTNWANSPNAPTIKALFIQKNNDRSMSWSPEIARTALDNAIKLGDNGKKHPSYGDGFDPNNTVIEVVNDKNNVMFKVSVADAADPSKIYPVRLITFDQFMKQYQNVIYPEPGQKLEIKEAPTMLRPGRD